MHSYSEIIQLFEQFFSGHQFPAEPSNLYEPCSYLLNMGGKRIRPVLCLMSHELFAELNQNAFHTATAIELFHNFTLMHDDIMDKAPLRRGFTTVHEKYGLPNAILSGDVMNIFSYVHLNKIHTEYIHSVIDLFNQTAIEICEGQQLDMNFESEKYVSVNDYMQMITLKTSVLLGASMKLGAMLGGATTGCSELLYKFGQTMGLAFQMKDDYLDAYGSSAKTGKQMGGDILSNKKTFLQAKAFEIADNQQQAQLLQLIQRNDDEKVQDTLIFFEELNIRQQLEDEILKYTEAAFDLLEKVPVISKRKVHLNELAHMLLNRES
ncbi:MAG: polyprenyl synthetase family protein [Chitinophagaceae bacterium]|nr:polyprenyl synthetase family protein [Chitinophagaceae bacterium]